MNFLKRYSFKTIFLISFAQPDQLGGFTSMLVQSPVDGSHLVSAAHEAPINTGASLCRWMTNKQCIRKFHVTFPPLVLWWEEVIYDRWRCTPNRRCLWHAGTCEMQMASLLITAISFLMPHRMSLGPCPRSWLGNLRIYSQHLVLVLYALFPHLFNICVSWDSGIWCVLW